MSRRPVRPQPPARPTPTPTPLQQALALHGAGRLAEAEALYRNILAADANHADALNLLGALRHQCGDAAGAEPLLLRAVSLRPDYAAAHCNLGMVRHALGRLDDAATSLRAALALRPQFAEASLNLANVLADAGRRDEALATLDALLVAVPTLAEAWFNRANLLQAAGATAAAIAGYQQAIGLRGDFVAARRQLATLQVAAGDRRAALAQWSWLAGNAAATADELMLAGKLALDEGELAAALGHYQHAARAQPASATPWIGQGAVLRQLLRFADSRAAFARATELGPDSADAWAGLGNAELEIGEAAAGVVALRRAVALAPANARLHASLLGALHYTASLSAAERHAEHLDWARRHADPLPPLPQAEQRRPGRWRIGYLSPDLREHSVARFILPVLRHHDRAQFEIHAYADAIAEDATARTIAGLVEHWRPVGGLADTALAELLRGDELDLLVELAGHTSQGRLLVLARRPARRQLTWIGYPHGTGMAAIDWRISDATADPPAIADSLHRERLLRLDPCFLCYAPPLTGDFLPASRNPERQRPRFASFNNLAKLDPACVALWAEILQRVPGAVLRLKNFALGDAAVRAHMVRRFAAHGIAGERLELLPASPDTRTHLRGYDGVDIALDSFPYNGTTTSCEALWMGVPVIAHAGDSHAGRVGASLLGAVGHPELVAGDAAGAADLAVALANDAARLDHYRQTLRQDLLGSPLTDGAAFTQRLEAAWRGLLGDAAPANDARA